MKSLIIFILSISCGIISYSIFSNSIKSSSIRKKSHLKHLRHQIIDNSYRNDIKQYTFDSIFTYSAYSHKISKEKIISVNERDKKLYRDLTDSIKTDFTKFQFKINVFDNFEDKGLITGSTDLSNINPKDSTINFVANDWIEGNEFSEITKLILQRVYCKPVNQFIQKGLAIYFSQKWREKGWGFWASKIYLAGEVPSLSTLFDNEKIKFISPFIYEPLAASYISFLRNNFPQESFKNIYTKLNTKNLTNNLIQSGWEKYLGEISKGYLSEIKNYKSNFNSTLPQFQKGFCFAHEGYQIFNGYLSREAVKSLESIKELGANSFSITPFTSMHNPNKPEPLRFWEFAGAENDECMIFLAHQAKILNMIAMMKPHIYMGRNGWPGEIKMLNKKDWGIFFQDYKNWIIHYAMIAEIYKIPILCVGNELAGATVGHENEWVKLVKQIRKIYDGKITYGANWSNEFEELKFWDQFDYIGISEYYPLSKKVNPTNKELEDGAIIIAKKIEEISTRFNKHVLFTEVGFRSSDRSWQTALEGESRNSVNLQSQKRCYNTLFRAMYKKHWLAGMYWWKWPSSLYIDSDSQNSLYTPLNKPSEEVIKYWYSKHW